MFYFPLRVLKGNYHYWKYFSGGLNQMEGLDQNNSCKYERLEMFGEFF